VHVPIDRTIRACAVGLISRDDKLLNQWAMDHTTTLAGGCPILALDMYEHSYHMDYGAKAAAYVDAFMAAINWLNVARGYGELRS
jgi:Fe-Mn family superoxide dismutase